MTSGHTYSNQVLANQGLADGGISIYSRKVALFTVLFAEPAEHGPSCIEIVFSLRVLILPFTPSLSKHKSSVFC